MCSTFKSRTILIIEHIGEALTLLVVRLSPERDQQVLRFIRVEAAGMTKKTKRCRPVFKLEFLSEGPKLFRGKISKRGVDFISSSFSKRLGRVMDGPIPNIRLRDPAAEVLVQVICRIQTHFSPPTNK